ncbi:MAG TPA: FmdB family transcriptional regulator [Trueperaceae bacterium]
MPVYVYRNLESGETFEVEQRITEPALSVHPETGAPVKRLIQPVGIAFKGSGFYVTDSRKQGAAAPKSSANDDSKPAADSKPAGKSESKSTDK